MTDSERTEPYSKDEQRVIDWLRSKVPDIGAGEDPIGFLMASYDLIQFDKKYLRWVLGAVWQDLEDGEPDRALAFLNGEAPLE